MEMPIATTSYWGKFSNLGKVLSLLPDSSIDCEVSTLDGTRALKKKSRDHLQTVFATN